MNRDRVKSTVSGGLMLLVLTGTLGISAWGIGSGARAHLPAMQIASALAGGLALVCLLGLFTLPPNEAKVLQLFGRYVGSVKTAGLHWANPLYTKQRVSMRAVSLESARLKVNDLDGNPIEIATILVWRVVDTAQASFNVESYPKYVQVQCEAALRQVAASYPYDGHDHVASLRGHTVEIADRLKREIQERVALAGIEVMEARISHLAYAPEIAQAMLQRQQASAIIAARQKIVEGAVGMVEMALERLSAHKIVEFDEERKAAMVSNLLVVLCGERAIQPVINTGTLYT